MFWWKRYEAILEQKPVSGDVAVADLIAKELVEMLEAFPPAEQDIEWTDDNFARRYQGRLHELPRLDARFVAQLLEIVKLDLDHDTDKIDWIWRNDHHREACPSAAHVDALRLLWPVIVEYLYQRKDECQGVMKRSHLMGICDNAIARFRKNALRIM